MFTKKMYEISKDIIIGFNDWEICAKEIDANLDTLYLNYSNIRYDDFVEGTPCDWFELIDRETGEILIIRLACGFILWLTDGAQPTTIEFK